jgi:hypothetical protein
MSSPDQVRAEFAKFGIRRSSTAELPPDDDATMVADTYPESADGLPDHAPAEAAPQQPVKTAPMRTPQDWPDELLSVRVEPELAERVKLEASRDRRTVSTFVRNLVEDSLAKRKPASENRESAA